MKKTIFSLLLLSTAYLNANELSVGCVVHCSKNHQRFYPYNVKNDMLLLGTQVSYQYIKPGSFYIGLFGTYLEGKIKVNDLTYLIARKEFKHRVFDTKFRVLEARVGYNFSILDYFFILPTLGVAHRHVQSVSKGLHVPLRMGYESLYITTGISSTLKISDFVEMGLNFKRTYSMRGESYGNSREYYLTHPMHGHEISFPLKANLNAFSVKLEPFFRKDDNRSKELIMGGILEGAFRY